jgi:hypothetical protein
MPCSAGGRTATYSFLWNMGVDTFTPKTVSRIGAATPIECLSEYLQVADGAYYLPLSSNEGVTALSGVASFADCITECDKKGVPAGDVCLPDTGVLCAGVAGGSVRGVSKPLAVLTDVLVTAWCHMITLEIRAPGWKEPQGLSPAAAAFMKMNDHDQLHSTTW